MQPLAGETIRSSDLRRALERLEGLPVRAVTARAVLDLAAGPAEDPELPVAATRSSQSFQTDPGWAADSRAASGSDGRLGLIADRPWWRARSPEAAAALEGLWKHAVAASGVARRLALEAGRLDADELARAALLHQLGLWAVAAVEPELLVPLLAARGRAMRRKAELGLLGREATAIGADLAERWGLGPLVVAAAWLHADARSELRCPPVDPTAMALIQQAHGWAERTPWALCPAAASEPGPADPGLRLLVAEVQVRCSAGLLDPEASAREESLSRAHARLLGRLARAHRALEGRDRFLRTIAQADPTESPTSWSERVARAWCEEPGIASARVLWRSEEPESGPSQAPDADAPARSRPLILPLGRRRTPAVELHLWPGHDDRPPLDPELVTAWGAWSDLVADRASRAQRLDDVLSAHRTRVDADEQSDRAARLDALAEFAAGAGHELNNPLAVIQGRAQLLIPRVSDPEAIRSLRVIIGQAQRAHRILRDLMYVARPPAPRPRPCQPDEVLRAALRDLKAEAEARGVRLIAEMREPVPVAWADPDPLRHLADVLVRNALEATPAGGCVRVSSGRAGERLRWVVRDSGQGVSSDEASHLFEPFFCGRQAGRGLGLGLPRIARFAAQVGGVISWRSTPGQGSVFAVELPIEVPPP